MREEAAVGCNDNVNDDEKIPTHRIWSSTSPSSMNRFFLLNKRYPPALTGGTD